MPVLPFEHVAIVGPGLIGGSVGMGLRRRGLARRVTGVGRREVSLEAAVKAGAIDSGTLDLEAGVREADLVLLCTSVQLIQEQAARVVPLLKAGAVLSDVGSSKQEIVTAIEALLAGRREVAYLGTHPLAGRERRGVRFAREDLFEGSLCLFCPSAHTTPDAAARLRALWEGLGASVRQVDAAEHDRLVSEISHLPHLLASALVNAVSDEALDLAATGFRDTTRVAAGDPDLWAAIFLSNRAHLVRGVETVVREVRAVLEAIERGDRRALVRALRRAKERRDSLA